MDQWEQYNSHGNGYPGPGIHRHEAGDFPHRHGPSYQPERDGSYGNEHMVASSSYTHPEIYFARSSTGGDSSNFQRGLETSPPNEPFFATTPQLLESNSAYSRNIFPEGMANSYGPDGGTFQQAIHDRSQEGGISSAMQPECQPVSPRRQQYSDSTVPYSQVTDWMPNEPSPRMSASFDSAPNLQYPASTTACANCGNYARIDSVPTHQRNQGDVDSNTDWSVHQINNNFLGPREQGFHPIQQPPTHEVGHDIPYNEGPDVPSLGQPTGLNPRNPTTIAALGNPLNVHVDRDCANKGPTKKRRRRPRPLKPRKNRTLTEEGKAHAKAIRKCPGGACVDCKRRKTKARDPAMTNLVWTRL